MASLHSCLSKDDFLHFVNLLASKEELRFLTDKLKEKHNELMREYYNNENGIRLLGRKTYENKIDELIISITNYEEKIVQLLIKIDDYEQKIYLLDLSNSIFNI